MPATPQQLQQSLQNQIAELQRQQAMATQGQGIGGSMGNPYARNNQIQQYSNQLNGLRQQLTQMRNAQAQSQQQAQTDAMTAERDANRNQILANTEGRAGELRNDPRANAAMDFLQGVVGGQNVPFNQEMRANYLTDAANTAGAQEAAQTQNLREQMANNGGSMSDPSAMAALRELQSRRGGQIAGAQNQIGMQAGQANFNAQMGGANSLAAVNAGQNAQINQMLMGANAARLGSTFNFGGQPQISNQGGGFSGGGMVNLGTVGGAGATQNGINGAYTPTLGGGPVRQAQPQQPMQAQPQQQAQPQVRPQQPARAQPSRPQPTHAGNGYVPPNEQLPGSGPATRFNPAYQVGNGDPIGAGYGAVQLSGQPSTVQYYNGTGGGNGDTFEYMDRARERFQKPVNQFGQAFGPILGK